MRRQTPLLSAVLFLFLAASARAANPVSESEAPGATPRLLRELERGAETVPLLIGVRDDTPSARTLLASPDPDGEPRRRVLRVAAQRRLAADMTPQRLAVRHFYEGFSILAGTATREAALALASRPDVAWVDLDRRARPLQVTPQNSQLLIRSDKTNALGFTGAGQTIAVIDTGVDYNVPDLGGAAFPNSKVIGGADIADEDMDPMDCEGHGTSIAAVAAGPRGVAPAARIVALKVFSSTDATNATCDETASFSDIIAAINYCISNRAFFGITVINISLGGTFEDSLDHGYCDLDEPGSTTAIDAAVAAGMVVAVASGNDGIPNQVAVPSCVSSAVSVGAVYPEPRTGASWSDGNGGTLCRDQPVTPDGIVCFTNSTSVLSLLAPGAFWNVVTKGGGQDSFNGTSPATAAVSGAIALLRQARPELTPAAVVGILRATGKPISDARNGVVSPRVDTLAAVQLPGSGFAIATPVSTPIPDGAGSATATATISGFTKPLHSVQVWAEINHPAPGQLRVTLIGPDGTSVVLQDQTGQLEHPINAIYGKTEATSQSLGAFTGRQPNGTWTLKVEDLVAGMTGSIKNFAVMPVALVERQSVSKRTPSATRVPRPLNPRP